MRKTWGTGNDPYLDLGWLNDIIHMENSLICTSEDLCKKCIFKRKKTSLRRWHLRKYPCHLHRRMLPDTCRYRIPLCSQHTNNGMATLSTVLTRINYTRFLPRTICICIVVPYVPGKLKRPDGNSVGLWKILHPVEEEPISPT